MAVKIVAALIGFIAGVMSYPWLDKYLLALVAFVGAIAVGIVVYMLLVNLLADLSNGR